MIKRLHGLAALVLCACLSLPLMGAAAGDVTVQIVPPKGWSAETAAVHVRITDHTGGGIVAASVKTDGDWRDLPLEQWADHYDGSVTLRENGPVCVRVTGGDGQTYEVSQRVACFDSTAPTVQAGVEEASLWAEAKDNLSGVAAIYVNGTKYPSDGMLDLPLSKLNGTQATVQAADQAGNHSGVVSVNLPPKQTQPVNTPAPTTQVKPSTTPIASTAPTPSTPPTPIPAVSKAPASTVPPVSRPTPAVRPTPTTSVPKTTRTPVIQSITSPSPTSTLSPTPISPSPAPTQDLEPQTDTPTQSNPLTPNGQGTMLDHADDEDGKEFFTVTTADGNTFYLVIDRQRGSENVYFLNTVTEADLLALAEKDEAQEGGITAIPTPEPVCTCVEQCTPGAVKTDCPVCALSMKDCTGKASAGNPEPTPSQEPNKPDDSGGSTWIVIALAVLAVGGVGYYLKIYKPKHELDDADDFDALTEETVNEDELDAQQNPYDEPDKPEDL